MAEKHIIVIYNNYTFNIRPPSNDMGNNSRWADRYKHTGRPTLYLFRSYNIKPGHEPIL